MDMIYLCGLASVPPRPSSSSSKAEPKWLPLHNITMERSGCAAVVLDGRIILCGGLSDEASQSCEEYDAEQNRWTLSTERMPQPHSYCTAVVYCVMTGSFNVQLELAQSGQVDDCYFVGKAYLDGGNVVQKNRLEAAKWLHQAFNKGHSQAKSKLAQV